MLLVVVQFQPHQPVIDIRFDQFACHLSTLFTRLAFRQSLVQMHIGPIGCNLACGKRLQLYRAIYLIKKWKFNPKPYRCRRRLFFPLRQRVVPLPWPQNFHAPLSAGTVRA